MTCTVQYRTTTIAVFTNESTVQYSIPLRFQARLQFMLHSINNWSVVQYSTNTTSVTKTETIPVTKILNLDTRYIHLYGYKCGYKANY